MTLTQKEEGWKTTNGNTAVARITATGSPKADGHAVNTLAEATDTTTIAYADRGDSYYNYLI